MSNDASNTAKDATASFGSDPDQCRGRGGSDAEVVSDLTSSTEPEPDSAAAGRGGRKPPPRFDWRCLIPGALSLVAAVLFTKTQTWGLVGIDVLTPAAFEDLRQVTSTADCARTVVGWNISFGSCDPWQRPYNYPEVWARALAILHLGEAQASYIGYALVLAFGACMVALTAIVRRRDRGTAALVLMSAASISPPALFALERGNIDIFVFALIVGAAVAMARKATPLAALLTASAAVLKLFPVGALVMIVSTRSRRVESVLVFVLTAGVGLLLTLPQLAYILGGTPWTTQQSFGVAVVPLAVQGLTADRADPASARALGLLLFLAIFVIMQTLLRSPLRRGRRLSGYRDLVLDLGRDDAARALVTGGGGCLLVAYLGGTSWDYRLTFLIPVLAGLFRLPRTPTVRLGLFLTTIVLFVNFWTGRTVEPWLGVGGLVATALLLTLVIDVTCTVVGGPVERLRTFFDPLGHPTRERGLSQDAARTGEK